jgi:hypothetical protein
MLFERPKASSTTKATEANGRTIFPISATSLKRRGGNRGDQIPTAPVRFDGPYYS